MKELIQRAEKLGLKDKLIFVAGGPRVTHPMALECGFDAGFSVGTKPSDVASYVVEEYLRRREASSQKKEPQKSKDNAKKIKKRGGLR
jgi:methylmalonyl-CoA mutase cobalamin-binding subunit